MIFSLIEAVVVVVALVLAFVVIHTIVLAIFNFIAHVLTL